MASAAAVTVLLACLCSAAPVAVAGIALKRDAGSAKFEQTNKGYVRDVPHLHDLDYHPETGALVFSELKSETHASAHAESGWKAQLYPVKINFDIEQFEPALGISMMFDKQNHKMQLNQGLSGGADAIAWGNFQDDIKDSGWSQLYVHTNPGTSLSNDVKMYAAGFVEGLLTCARISQFYANNHILLLKDESTHHALMNIKTLLENEIGFVKFKGNIVPHIMAEEPADAYWKHIRYQLFQLWGLNDGYNFWASHFKVHTLSLVDMLLINSDGELPELMEAYNPLAVMDRAQAQSPPLVFAESGSETRTESESELQSEIAWGRWKSAKMGAELKAKVWLMQRWRENVKFLREALKWGKDKNQGVMLVRDHDRIGCGSGNWHCAAGAGGCTGAANATATASWNVSASVAKTDSLRALASSKSGKLKRGDFAHLEDTFTSAMEKMQKRIADEESALKAFQEKHRKNHELMEAAAAKANATHAHEHALAHAAKHIKQAAAERERKGKNPNGAVDPLSDSNWEQRVAQDGHCSAYVRVTDGMSDLLVGHTTWNDYSEMTRVFKYYTFPLDGSKSMTKAMAMSSYPGLISSTDDYYVLDSGLVVMDTSLEILNPQVYDYVKDFPVNVHVPNFMHLMAVNRMAKTSADWAREYLKMNLGTYNAQWMIVDYNNFEPGSTIKDNVLWVVETIPGYSEAQDMSHALRENSYWASFNRPFFKKIREPSGHWGAQKSHGNLYSYFDNPRAKIFGGAGVESLFDMRGLMHRNLYPFGGVEPNEPGHDISARMDLNPLAPIPNGGIDSKIVNRCLFKQLSVQGVSGPTHDVLPPFRWESDDGQELWPGFPHIGLPATWDFGWVQFTPTGKVPMLDISDC